MALARQKANHLFNKSKDKDIVSEYLDNESKHAEEKNKQ
jgi:hypothetical protein